MFWKKKKIEIELPDDDHREAFRVRPSSDQPVILKAAGNSYYVQNISGTGCSFRSSGLQVGMSAAGTLTIQSEDVVFPVTIQVVYKQRDLCRCKFSKISASAQNTIHMYVLEIQKNMIRG